MPGQHQTLPDLGVQHMLGLKMLVVLTINAIFFYSTGIRFGVDGASKGNTQYVN